MQIVIDIPDRIHYGIELGIAVIDGSQVSQILMNAVKLGIILPKGHGNLIQREDAEAIFKNARKALYEQSRKERINDFQTRELMLLNAEQFVHLIQPIIKADAKQEDEYADSN